MANETTESPTLDFPTVMRDARQAHQLRVAGVPEDAPEVRAIHQRLDAAAEVLGQQYLAMLGMVYSGVHLSMFDVPPAFQNLWMSLREVLNAAYLSDNGPTYRIPAQLDGDLFHFRTVGDRNEARRVIEVATTDAILRAIAEHQPKEGGTDD